MTSGRREWAKRVKFLLLISYTNISNVFWKNIFNQIYFQFALLCHIFDQICWRKWRNVMSRLGKITSAVRLTGASRSNEAPIGTPFKVFNTIVMWWSEGFQGGHQSSPHDDSPETIPHMNPHRDASLSDSYTSDRCCFSSLGLRITLQLHRIYLI